MDIYILKTIFWFLGMCIIFNFMVVFLFKSGFVNETRDDRGHLKKKQSFKGLLVMLLFSLFVIIIMIIYNYSLFNNNDVSFWKIISFDFIIIMLMVFYDSFIIDLLVIGIIRPKIINLPDSMNINTMKEHVKLTFIKGWIFIIPLISIPSIIYYFIFA